MKISACIIAKNEENNLVKCFDSYKDIVDEIILVDTGSIDNTIKIGEKYGANIFHYEWNNDFAEAKNYALNQAKGNWIIFLDADEYFDYDSSKKIRDMIIKVNRENYDAIICNIINIDLKTGNKIETAKNIRVFKKDKDIKYKNSIHECLNKTKGKINALLVDDINIYHTGYSKEKVKLKAERNLQIILNDIKRNGDSPQYYRYLSDCYFILEEYEKSIKYGRLHLKEGTKLLAHESRIYKNIIGSLYLLNYSRKEIEKEIKNAINKFPDTPNFYSDYGYFLLDNRMYDESLKTFLLALKYNKEYNGMETNFVVSIIPDIKYRIAFIYYMRKDYEKSFDYSLDSIKEDKFNINNFNLIIKLFKNQKPEDVIEFINSIYNINNEKEVGFLVGQLCKLKMEYILPYYTSIWFKQFKREDSALTFSLLANGNFDLAFKIFYKGYISDFSRSNAIFSIVTAIGSENDENLNKLKDKVKPSFKRIINCYLNIEDKLYKEDLSDYISILKEIIILSKIKKDRYLNLKYKFEEDISNHMGKLMFDNELYDDAILNYKGYVLKNKEDNKNYYLLIGYSYYRLNNYDEACTNFRKAIQSGYIENDILEFLKWVEDKTEEKQIKQSVQQTINMFNKLKLAKEKFED